MPPIGSIGPVVGAADGRACNVAGAGPECLALDVRQPLIAPLQEFVPHLTDLTSGPAGADTSGASDAKSEAATEIRVSAGPGPTRLLPWIVMALAALATALFLLWMERRRRREERAERSAEEFDNGR